MMIKYKVGLILMLLGSMACSKSDDGSQVYAGFDVSSEPYYAPCEVIFYNQSVNTTSYHWEFGDSTSTTEANPTHTYTEPGRYEVTLTASNGSGSGSYSLSLLVKEAVPIVTAPPESLGLDPFYTKYLDAMGIPVVSSDNVPDEALINVMEKVNWMMQEMPEVRDKIIFYHGRVGIMSEDEVTTDIPEHAFLANDTIIDWDDRARGLGGTVAVPISTCAEENILCYSIDKYKDEDIMIHEFAHAIHLMGLQYVYPNFVNQLTAIYNAALAAGKWENTYAATNIEEYWSEGVQDWFNCNNESIPPDGIHNHVNTRAELKDYDPDLHALLENYFTQSEKSISCHTYNK